MNNKTKHMKCTGNADCTLIDALRLQRVRKAVLDGEYHVEGRAIATELLIEHLFFAALLEAPLLAT